MSLRKAKIEDAHAIMLLSDSLDYLPGNDNEFASRLKILTDSDINEVWVFEQENKLVGWVHAFLANRVASTSFVEIGGLVVDPDFRNKGIGKSLIKQAKDWANANNKKLRVRTDSRREIAHSFYLSAGFTKMKNQDVFELK
ncbi:MAG: GNAT family N-acetyltransferase [Gammaproteobacteria bacterium]|nr:GNAT family N-acetyltransferase [Gammaproteobacteria bacterium]